MSSLPLIAHDDVPPFERYTHTAATLHWTIAVLLIANIFAGLYCTYVNSSIRQTVMNVHKVVGLSVLAISLARLAWRIAHRPPPLQFRTSFERLAASSMHAVLYALMIIIPLSGWLVTSSFPQRHPINAGLFQIPFLPVTPNKAVASMAHSAHTVMAWTIILLIVGHVCAALRHQYILRDALIARMFTR